MPNFPVNGTGIPYQQSARIQAKNTHRESLLRTESPHAIFALPPTQLPQSRRLLILHRLGNRPPARRRHMANLRRRRRPQVALPCPRGRLRDAVGGEIPEGRDDEEGAATNWEPRALSERGFWGEERGERGYQFRFRASGPPGAWGGGCWPPGPPRSPSSLRWPGLALAEMARIWDRRSGAVTAVARRRERSIFAEARCIDMMYCSSININRFQLML